MYDNTWTCHVCGERRPDEKISVVTKPLIVNGAIWGEQNVRHCNDNDDCYQGALDYDFVKIPPAPAEKEPWWKRLAKNLRRSS